MPLKIRKRINVLYNRAESKAAELVLLTLSLSVHDLVIRKQLNKADVRGVSSFDFLISQKNAHSSEK